MKVFNLYSAFKDYYKILGLETSRVSLEDVKIAYRAAAKKNHPDVNVGDKLAEEKIKDINEAYRVLSNASAKRKYDRIWNSNVGNKKQRAFTSDDKNKSSIFNMFFGNIEEEKVKTKKEIPIKGENIETEIKVSIEDAFYGLTKKISLRTVDGNMKTFSIAVPSGIRDGEKIRLIGQGKSGENGGKNGDLFIKINIENNDKFKLHGCDLHTDLLLTPWEAALGTRVQLNSIDDTAQIYIPQGIQSGEVVRIPGKGYKKGEGTRGDLVAQVKVVVPKKLTKIEKEIFEELSKKSEFNPRMNANT